MTRVWTCKAILGSRIGRWYVLFYSCIDMWLFDDVLLVELLDTDLLGHQCLSETLGCCLGGIPLTMPFLVLDQYLWHFNHLMLCHTWWNSIINEVTWVSNEQTSCEMFGKKHQNFEKWKLWCVRRPTDENIRMIYHLWRYPCLAETSQRYWCRCERVDAFVFKVPYCVVWEEVLHIFQTDTVIHGVDDL